MRCILIAWAKNDVLILIQNTVVGYGKPALLPTPTKAGIATATLGQLAPSQVLPSSTTQPGHHNRAQADSSKKEKVSSSIPESVLFYDAFFFFSLKVSDFAFPFLETTDSRESYKWSEDSHKALLPKEGNHKGGVQRDCPQSSRKGKASCFWSAKIIHLLCLALLEATRHHQIHPVATAFVVKKKKLLLLEFLVNASY